MRIPEAIVDSVWRRYARDGRKIERMTFPDGTADAIDLEAGPGGGSVLRSDGMVFEWGGDAVDFVTLRVADERTIVRCLAIAARRRLPELRAALPTRSQDAVDCASCAGHGFLDLGEHPKAIVCFACDGLGWVAA